MATAATAPGPGHNEAALLSTIQRKTAEIVTLETQRKKINADISAARAEIKASNIDMDAWRASKRRQEMDPDVRAEFDRSHAFVNKALGVPVQGDMFANDDDGGKAADAAAFDAADAAAAGKGPDIPASPTA